MNTIYVLQIISRFSNEKYLSTEEKKITVEKENLYFILAYVLHGEKRKASRQSIEKALLFQ